MLTNLYFGSEGQLFHILALKHRILSYIVALSHCRVVATTCTTNTGDEAKAGQGDGTRLAGTVLAAR